MSFPLLRLALPDESRGIEVSIEDDGRAAWAFIEQLGPSGRTLAGVWLYNRSNTNDDATTTDVALTQEETDVKLPRNPQRYVVDEEFAPISSERDVRISFGGGVGLEAFAEISIRSKLHAVLEACTRTGWCVLAKSSGPMAKAMKVKPDADGSLDVHLSDY